MSQKINAQKNLFQKNLCPNKNLGPKILCSQNFWSKKILGSQKFGSNKILVKGFLSKKLRPPKVVSQTLGQNWVSES